MVKISLDDFCLSKMNLQFVGEKDRTCKTLSNYIVWKILKVPFQDRFNILKAKTGLVDMNKIVAIL